ncbi:hypothetical protein D3C76_1068940 [compost metagenome]
MSLQAHCMAMERNRFDLFHGPPCYKDVQWLLFATKIKQANHGSRKIYISINRLEILARFMLVCYPNER